MADYAAVLVTFFASVAAICLSLVLVYYGLYFISWLTERLEQKEWDYSGEDDESYRDS